MRRTSRHGIGIACLVFGLICAPYSTAFSDPDLYVTVTPPQPVSGDVIHANYSFHCDGPITVDQTGVAVRAMDVNVFLKATCNGLAFDAKAGSVVVGTLTPGTYTIRLFLQGRSDPSYPQYEYPPYVIASNQFTVSPIPGTANVREFYHPGLDHYFITADPAEAQALINGVPPGWTPTGSQFMALTAAARTDATTAVVCRFYGSVTPGPNSHFYTLFADECAALKSLAQSTPANVPRWNYEGVAFDAVVPAGVGTCPAAFPQQVRRFYNGRSLQNDSNHRYVIGFALAYQMFSSRWIDEGVVMCASDSFNHVPPAN